jgi:hypothetical protein
MPVDADDRVRLEQHEGGRGIVEIHAAGLERRRDRRGHRATKR